MANDEDRARLIAALTIAVESSRRHSTETFQERLLQAGESTRGSYWAITVGRDLTLGPLAWINHPWHCYKLKHLVRQLLNQELSGVYENEASKQLARCSAMIEFGVDVNPKWYRRLRESVIDNKVSVSEMRSLLRHSTVWWGTSVRSTSGTSSTAAFFRSIWSMGRPSDGELLLRQHHWFTKITILAMLLLSGLAFGIVCTALIHYIHTRGTMYGAAGLISASLMYGVIFLASWWIGPGSWSAVSRLQLLLHSPSTTDGEYSKLPPP